MIHSPPEDWADALEEIATAIAEGRMRALAWLEHKPVDEIEEDARYRYGQKGYAEANETLLATMSTQAALRKISKATH